MIFRLQLTKKREDEIRGQLLEKGIGISDDSDLILTEVNFQLGHLIGKDDSDTVMIDYDDILYIESIDRDVLIHTNKRTYKSSQRIYQLEKELPENKFIRISNSVIIHRKSIKRITPALSSKFYLSLLNGDTVTVTRTYYFKFKDYYNI